MTTTTVRRFVGYLPTLLLGRPLRGRERYRPFFIVGSGRCGSTRLRAMLEAHPDVHIPPESALGSLMREYRWYSRFPWNVVLRMVLAPLAYERAWAPWELPFDRLFHELAAVPERARNLATVLEALYRLHAKQHKRSAVRWGDKTPPNTAALPTLQVESPPVHAS